MIYESLYVYILIAVTGALTVYTDIKEGKIKNAHLAVILTITAVLYCIFMAKGALKISLLIPVNILAGLILGFILYAVRAWKAGDAKLFFLYSLLLVPTKNSYVLFLPCLSLFANIFLISFIVLIPLSLKDILCHKEAFFKNVASKNFLISFIKVWLIAFSVSFFIGPLINAYLIPDNTMMSLAFIFFCYLIYQLLARIKYITLFVSVLIVCAALKLLLFPEFPAIKEVMNFIGYTAGYSAITILFTRVITSEEKKYTRLPFSPFMLTGAILSTTPFLERVIQILRYLK